MRDTVRVHLPSGHVMVMVPLTSPPTEPGDYLAEVTREHWHVGGPGVEVEIVRWTREPTGVYPATDRPGRVWTHQVMVEMAPAQSGGAE